MKTEYVEPFIKEEPQDIKREDKDHFVKIEPTDLKTKAEEQFFKTEPKYVDPVAKKIIRQVLWHFAYM